MDRKCEIEGCDNLVEDASAPDLRASFCADHLMDIVCIVEKFEKEKEADE